MTVSQQPGAVERFDAIVIGAGQAGLATAYHLAQSGARFAVLDAAARVGDSWRARWDSLRLFTPAAWITLPGLSYPSKGKDDFPTKDETADFMTAYAEKFSLPVRSGVRVERLGREGDRYVVTAGGRRLEAASVVVATGPYQKPRVPAFATELAPGIAQLHSSAYRNPGQVAEGDVLVVGAATSGAQIAMELAKTRKVYLAGDSVGKVPAPILRPIFPFVASRPRNSFLGKKLHVKARTKGHPLIGFTYKDVLRAGVERVPRVASVEGGKPRLADGRVLDVASVLWGTGYDVNFSWIDLPIFEADGYPRHDRGVVEGEAGLYFVGLIFQHSLDSALLLGVGRDAKYVADELLRRNPPSGAAAAREPGVQASGSVA